eukprot:764511-Hanusia_phi.AAC.2
MFCSRALLAISLERFSDAGRYYRVTGYRSAGLTVPHRTGHRRRHCGKYPAARWWYLETDFHAVTARRGVSVSRDGTRNSQA